MGGNSSKEKLDPRDHRRVPKNIKAEYVLDVTCLDCARWHRVCRITPDLNSSLQHLGAYRNPANAGGAQKWKLAIDFCSVGGFREKSPRAQDAVKRACGGGDRTYRDEGMGSTYGGGGVKPGIFGRGGDKAARATGPFHVDALLQELRAIGVEFRSSI